MTTNGTDRMSAEPDTTAGERASRDRAPDRVPTAPTDLAPEQRALLERLATGATIAAAAQAEYLSLRTANRRIAQARQLLGASTTREAVVTYLRMRRDGDRSPARRPA
ncbi:hypothetical protein ACNTMW_06595 [Planosporangium sp. 12N6]|uniref:hypothetical protein n=1 Tax=Planosporangium spinosum TaxID=3402278 RepID=UPI003CF32300